MRVLITAATRHDATREIAEAIGAGLSERGIDAETRPIDEVTDLAGYDAVVLGSAVYMGRG
jgi:menaquinone-dependent protoporphyrinogen oxidase